MSQKVTKASPYPHRSSSKRILILKALGTLPARGLEPMIGMFVVNQEGTFMPRGYAEKLQPEEFVAMARDLLKREKDQAKKNRQQSGLLDLQLNRDNIGGLLAITQNMLVAGPDDKPVRLMNRDIYLADGAGIAIKTVCNPEAPGAESKVINTVRTLRVLP